MSKLTNVPAAAISQLMVAVAAGQKDPHNMALIQCIADIVGRTFTLQLKPTYFNFLGKHQSFTISRIFDLNEPLLLPNFENQKGHNNQGDDMRGAGPVSQFFSADVDFGLPGTDPSTVLTMLFLLTAEASLEWSSIKASHEMGVSAMSNMLLPNYFQSAP